MTLSMIRTRRAAWAAALLGASLLASCGGGTQVETFVPNRVLALGDESSVILTSADFNGHKFTINGLNTDKTAIDCKVNPIWVQSLASVYGLVFPECNPAGTGAVVAPVSRIAAFKDAVVSDIAAQVVSAAADGALNDKDLVTVFVGARDIVLQYQAYSGANRDQLIATVQDAGVALGEQVNSITDSGAKVLLALAPDLSLTPYAIKEEAAHPNEGRTQLIKDLVDAFNAKVRVTIVNDGRKIALLKTNELIQNVVANVNLNVLTNVTDVACDLAKATLDNCTSLTLTDAASAADVDVGTWLWADELHLSAEGHSLLGTSAINQVGNNPF